MLYTRVLLIHSLVAFFQILFFLLRIFRHPCCAGSSFLACSLLFFLFRNLQFTCTLTDCRSDHHSQSRHSSFFFFLELIQLLVSFSRMRYYIYIIISFSLVFALIIHHQSNLKTLFEKYQGSKEINCQVNFLCGQVFLFSRSRSPVADRILLISRKVISSQQQFFISDHVHITCMNRI